MTVTDATARPPLQLADVVTVTAAEYERLVRALSVAEDALNAYEIQGFISETGLRAWREARDGATT